MSNKKDDEPLIEEINKEIETLNITKTENENLEKLGLSFTKTESFASFKSNSSEGNEAERYGTFETIPFKEELDLDLPNFNPTKYNTYTWKFVHCILYSIFSFALLIRVAIYIIKKKNVVIAKLVADLTFLAYNCMTWFHYKRGCIGDSNLNSKIKTNIDKSLKARLLRSEFGWKYFFGLIGSFILIYGDIYYFFFCEEQNPDFWNINFVGLMIISLSQILKIEKILTENNQYKVINDLPNSFVEIFLFFGSLLFSISYLIQMVYYYNIDNFRLFNNVLQSLGTVFILVSVISLIYRYFLSGYDDLNTSQISNLTI